jgi:hypothetical protein
MARVGIKINGTAGSNLNFGLSSLATFTNAGDGSETQFLWELLEEPPGDATPLTGTATAVMTFTPEKRGSYLVQLTVNPGQSGAIQDRVILAVRHQYIRIPAAKERLETGADGWAPDLQEALGYLDDLIAASLTNVVEQIDVSDSPYYPGNRETVHADTSAGAGAPFDIDVELPRASAGLRIHVMKSDVGANVVSINGSMGELINGVASYVRNNQYDSVTVYSDGTNWFVE